MQPITTLLLFVLFAPLVTNDDPPLVTDVDAQPLVAHVTRLSDALQIVGRPLADAERARFDALRVEESDRDVVEGIQRLLDPHVLIHVNINPESRVKVRRGEAPAELMQNGWRSFLVKVVNEAGVTASLEVSSPQAQAVYTPGTNVPDPKVSVSAGDVRDRWADVDLFRKPPLVERLSGLGVEYAILSVYARDVGRREATLAFDVGQGTQDLGFRAETAVLFDARPAVEVEFGVVDHDGEPTTANFVIEDALGRIYPAPSKRLAPDFFFHPQVYRADGDVVRLPPGEFSVTWARGPEYLEGRRTIRVPEDGARHRETFELERWIFPRRHGWYSGDHHVHGGGCAHYESPSAGVRPEDMRVHQLGEDLNVACVLSWGPCWYFQKEFFEGRVSDLSTPDYQMRYDVEVSGFPSQHCGHLCLLRLTEDDYPGTERIEQWPSWDLPILRWGQAQGGVVGFSHSGWGLAVETDELPNLEMPAFDGIGANEFIVDVTHDAVDFISAVDTPYVWELNIWYHTLNCGFRARISGETDFPCIYGERIGLGRSYCRLDDQLDFDGFCEALKDGRSYVGDGRSHLMDFAVNGHPVGVEGSEVRLDEGGPVRISARVAARLAETPDEELRGLDYRQKPYWHVERARVGDSRRVPVEVIVNGQPVARREIDADGSLTDLEIDVELERSSWVALRILPSSHTNPVFVIIGDQPIRASADSARWCLEAVDVCFASKVGRTRPEERPAMSDAYEHARQAYRRILSESD